MTLGDDWGERVKAYEKEHGPTPVATVGQVADHVEYLARQIGAGRVGIGSDFWGAPENPKGLEDVSCFPNLLAEMILRGWSDDHVAGLAGFNFLRVFRAVEREGQRLRASSARGRDGASARRLQAPAG
jgi:membrane dipeptidase